jgi:hypothetical protein
MFFSYSCDIDDAKSLFEENVVSFKEEEEREYDSMIWLKINLTFELNYEEEELAVFENTDNQSILAICDGLTSKCYRDGSFNWYVNIHRDFLNLFARLNVCGCAVEFERNLLLNVVLSELTEHHVLSVATFRDVVLQLHGLLSYATSLSSKAPRLMSYDTGSTEYTWLSPFSRLFTWWSNNCGDDDSN